MERSEFQYSAEIKGPLGIDRIYRIHPGPDIIRKSSPGFFDLRLVGKGDAEIPYVVIENREAVRETRSFDLRIVEYVENDNSMTIVARCPRKELVLNKLKLHVRSRNFSKGFMLYGSSNRHNWKFISKGSLYDFSSRVNLKKTDIRFNDKKYMYYRIVMSDREGQADSLRRLRLKHRDLDFTISDLRKRRLRLDGITGISSGKRGAKDLFDEVQVKEFSSEIDENGNSIITVDASLPLWRVDFEISNSYFFRKVDVMAGDSGKNDSYESLGSFYIYNFPVSGVKESVTDISPRSTKKKFYRFIIENKNNPPLKVQGMKFTWPRRYLYFISHENLPSCRLYFGSQNIDKPDYDLAQFITEKNWFTHKFTELKHSEINENADYDPSVSVDERARVERIILIAVVMLLLGGMAFWIYRLASHTLKGR